MDRRSFIAATALSPMAALAAPASPAARVRVTVLKRSIQRDFEKYSWGPIPICDRVKEGQQFTITSDTARAPEGMCDSAWEHIEKRSTPSATKDRNVP